LRSKSATATEARAEAIPIDRITGSDYGKNGDRDHGKAAVKMRKRHHIKRLMS